MKIGIWIISAVLAAAQSLTMDFAPLAEKAKSKVELNLDGAALDAARQAVPQAEKFSGVQSVSVHVYEYAKEGDYPMSAIEAVIKQVEGRSGWKRVLQAREDGERVEIFLKSEGTEVVGFLVVAAESKEVAIVEATGRVELANLREVVTSTLKFDLAALTEQ